MSSRVYNLENWRDKYEIFIVNREEVQKQTCERLISDFGLTKEESASYYEMIKDDENNKIIEEIEEKVRVKVAQTGSFNIEYNKE